MRRSQHDGALALFTPRVRCQALASISHVARLSVLSKRRGAPCAFRAHYADGVLVPAPGARAGDTSAAPQPCAGVDGTTITVEDLFHNMTIRRRALRSPAEQYQRILEVVTRYAIHFGVRGVAFTCTKHGAPSADLHVTAAAAASRRNVIRLVCVHSGAATCIRALAQAATTIPCGDPLSQVRGRARTRSGRTQSGTR